MRAFFLSILPLVLLGACGNPFADVRVDRDNGHGDRGSEARHPGLCSSDGHLYAAWADDRDGTPQIRFRSSEDGGRTWGDEVPISRGPEGSVADRPAIACDLQTVAVVWEDDRHSDLGDPTVYARVSSDGGATWTAEQRITSDARGDWRSLEPRVAVWAGRIYATWHDNRFGAFDVFFNTSDDGGDGWLEEEVRLDADPPGSAYSAHSRLAIDGLGGVYVVWEDSRGGLNDIYFNRSYDHGAPGTWLAADLRLDTGDPAGSANSFAPSIDVAYDRIAVAWHDRRNGIDPPFPADVYVQVSSTEGLGFFGSPVRVGTDAPGEAESLFPSVAVIDDDTVGVVWRDDRQGAFDVLFARSEDGGRTWSPEVAVDRASADDADTPVLAKGASGQLAVAWSDLRNSPSTAPREDVFVSTSEDGGITWAPEWRVNDYPPGHVRAVFPSVQVDPGRDEVQVLWEDWRDGNPDIYFRAAPLGGSQPEVAR